MPSMAFTIAAREDDQHMIALVNNNGTYPPNSGITRETLFLEVEITRSYDGGARGYCALRAVACQQRGLARRCDACGWIVA
jgi:hypothetical protein